MGAYSVHDHGVMIADRVRVDAYREALRRVVKPGDVVVDIGTGSGLFALFACQSGAAKVYAIEPDEVVELAKQLARDNGADDRITFIRALSTEVDVPERANVIVSDMHGGLPLYHSSLNALIDARQRFLAPGGTMIPLRERVWTAVCGLDDADYGCVAVWIDGRCGVELSSGAHFGSDSPFSATVKPERMVTEPSCVATVDHLHMKSPSVRSSLCLRAVRDGEANGFAFWFDNDLTDGVSITTAPGRPATVYPNQFAPWPHPVILRQGDCISAELRFDLVQGDYVWTWNTRIHGADGVLRHEFRQSSLKSAFVVARTLQKTMPSYRPHLSGQGITAQLALHFMDGSRSLQEIARAIMEAHPRAFGDEKSAVKAVSELVARYSD